MIVNTKEQAWVEANRIFPTDYEKDAEASEIAGYDIYRHYELNHYNRICDLGDRLEVLTGEYGEKVVNIWIEPEPEKTQIGMGHVVRALQIARFGHEEIMAIRTAMITGDFSKINFCTDYYSEKWDDTNN